MQSIRKLTVTEYHDLRKKVRNNIFINSQQVLSKRHVFSDKDVVMGGVVIKKTQCIERTWNRGKARISRLDLANEAASVYDDSNYATVKETVNFEFKIYDFTGTFEMVAFTDDQSKDQRLRIFKVKEGDIIYLIGKIIPINSEAQYFVLPSLILSEDEWMFYKVAYERKLLQMKRFIDEATICRKEAMR